jgi:hypothetical protein
VTLEPSRAVSALAVYLAFLVSYEGVAAPGARLLGRCHVVCGLVAEGDDENQLGATAQNLRKLAKLKERHFSALCAGQLKRLRLRE